MTRWKVLYHPKVAEEDISRLDGATRQRVRRAIEAKLLTRPEEFGKPLRFNLAGLWSLRVGDWRVVFAIREDELWILRIGHRSEIYTTRLREIPRR